MGKRIDNDTRQRIVTGVLMFGKTQAKVAEELDVNYATVNSIVTMFGLVKDGDYAHLEKRAISSKWGIEGIRWAFSVLGKTVPEDMLDRIYTTTKKNRVLTKEEPKSAPDVTVPEEPPTGAKIHIPAASAETGWQTRIKVKPDRLSMTVYFNGVPVVEGFSRIRGDKELDLMQAISYAAHMCYKISEQKKLCGR